MPFDVKEYEYRRVTRDRVEVSTEQVAVERQVTLVINGIPRIQLMASPSDLEELGYGVLLSSGIVSSKHHVRSIRVSGNEILVDIDGLEEGGDLSHRLVSDMGIGFDLAFTISPEYVFRSLEHLETDTYRSTSGVHSATILDADCRILARGVDAGRHNAYDKAIGKAFLMDIDLRRSVLLASGRQSAEMVSKAVNAGIPIVISKAAPISSGIDAAREAGLTLICFADHGKFSVFSGIERIHSLP